MKDETPLVFPFTKEDDEDYESEFESNVEINKNTSDLQKALRNLRSKAKTAIEEQGVNVLYCCRWSLLEERMEQHRNHCGKQYFPSS